MKMINTAMPLNLNVGLFHSYDRKYRHAKCVYTGIKHKKGVVYDSSHATSGCIFISKPLRFMRGLPYSYVSITYLITHSIIQGYFPHRPDWYNTFVSGRINDVSKPFSHHIGLAAAEMNTPF